MKRSIDISNFEAEVTKLERAYLEVMGRENILNYLINNGKKNSLEFKEFWSDYIDQLRIYENVKNKFFNTCLIQVLGNYDGNWIVDFEKREVVIDE